jgi:type IV secretion system protein VirD4
VVAAALDDLLRENPPGVPVLVILDEFYQLGRLKVIQNAMSLARGYGLQLWPILQDLTQLQEHYEKSWETFLGNAAIRMFFAPREFTTAEYVSKLCGETTVTVKSKSEGKSENSGRGLFDGVKRVSLNCAMIKGIQGFKGPDAFPTRSVTTGQGSAYLPFTTVPIRPNRLIPNSFTERPKNASRFSEHAFRA